MSKREEEEAIRRSNALKKNELDALRKYSRQEFLKKREQKKLDELRYKKQIYELVKKQSEEDDNVNEYRIPDAYDQEGGVNQERRFSVAEQRYRDPNVVEKMNPFAEQEAWEGRLH